MLIASSVDRHGRLSARPLTQSAHLREAVFEDYPQIAALEERCGLTSRSREDWLKLWQDNPVYAGLHSGWPIGWVLETRHQGIVGSIGNIALSYSFGGRKYLGASACGWAIDPDYRRFSFALLEQFVRQKRVDLLICTTVGVTSENCYRFFGFSRVPAGEWNRSAYWITGGKDCPRVPFTNTSRTAHNPRTKRPRSLPRAPELDVADSSSFDSRIDDFWDELESGNPQLNLALRNSRALTWHFRLALLRKTAWIVSVFRRSRLIAYAVFVRQDNPQLGLHRIRLIDFQAVRDHEAALRAVLSQALARCRAERMHLLEVVGCWQERRQYGRILAPHHHELTSWTQYFKANHPGLDHALKDPSAWAPSLYDGDASL